MTTTARHLADRLRIDERTMRRAVEQGTVRARRVSARRIEVPIDEEQYLRESWPLLQRMRAALRTEPNVRFAVVFGSFARGTAREGSDVDLLVELSTDSWERRQRLNTRLEQALLRPVDLVLLEHARRDDPPLLADIVRDGRVLVDRADAWVALQSQQPAIERAARAHRMRLANEARTAVSQLMASPAESL